MEKKSPRILSKLSSKSSSSKSTTLSKDFKNKNNNSSEDKTIKQSSSTTNNNSNKVSLSFKELKKQQDKQLKLQQQQFKLQKKQLKLQQKKLEKEQKQNTLKSNKNKTPSSNDQINNEQPILIDDEKRFSDGIKFRGKLVGIEPVMSARGDKLCQDALKNLKLRRTSSHKQRIILNINLNGVQLLDQKTNELVANHVINLISYITRDISDNRTFGYVYGTPDIGHQFIAIKSEKDSMYVMNAIGELFTYVYNKKKKEKQELEQRQNQFQDQSIAENSQSSHTIVDDKQPQSSGFDNETLMEFLKQQQDKINNQQSTLPTTTIQDDFNHSTNSKGFNDFNDEKENRYLSQQSDKFNTLPILSKNTLPPPLPPRLESGQSNYSSNSNLNLSFGTYSHSNFDTSTHFQSTSNNYQSNLSLATTHNSQYETCSDLQQMQNVISSARKANDKFKNWHQFDEDNNNMQDDFGSNSLISERDDENESINDDNWANFNDIPPPDHPPPLYQSNEDLSITTTSADTYTLTNQQQQQQQSDFNNQFNNEQFNTSNQTINKQHQQINNSLNNSQNSTTFAVRLDTPPSSNRRRRSTRLSESSAIIPDNLNNINKEKQKVNDLNETNRRQSEPQNISNQFETNFNLQHSNEFFDFDKVKKLNNENVDNKNLNQEKTQSFLSKELNHSFDLNREDNSSRNDSRISNYNSNQFNSFDSQFNIQQQNDNRIFADNFDQSIQTINSLNNNNENSSSSFNRERKKSTDNNQPQQFKLVNKRLSLNELSKKDPNDKYAVFNDINSMKFSIFSTDGTLIEKNETDQVFLTNNQSLNLNDLAINNKNVELINNSDNNNKSQNFEDSFLSTGNNSLNQSKNSSLYSTSINKSTQLNQSSNLINNNNKESISSNNSIYSSFTADPELIECHKKFLKERQEKLDQIDKIFEDEKQKIRTRQKELNQEHLKQQKKLLNQQKTYQQEFYQRQKHQRQTILHQLQLQRLPVQQFDQCKLQLQQKLKDDQKNLQQEFIKKQQELKKQQIEEQNQLIKQYKTLEEQYLEKQSELLNSDFEIELDLPEVPNIFDHSQLLDDNLQIDEQALTKKFELSLKNEFDKLNEIVQTTASSLNSSPKLQERCSTACSIASSNNPFISDDKFSFEDFDRALNLIDNKIDWKGSGHSSLTSAGGGRQYDLDFYMFNNTESKDNSLEYNFTNNTNNTNTNILNNERISSASSLDMNRSTSTLPSTFINKTIDNTLNKSLNNEPFTNKLNSGIELKKPQFNLNNSFRSQQQLTSSFSNSVPKSLDNNSNSLSNLGTDNNFQSSSNFSSTNYPLNQSLSHQKSAFKQPYSLPQSQNDPFNTFNIDNKLNEINRIKQLRQETQQQLVSLALPSSSITTDKTSSSNKLSNQETSKNQFIQPNQVKLEPLEEKKKPITNTSIQELEDLLGLSTSTLNKNKLNNTNNNNDDKLFSNLFDLKNNNNLVNFTPTTTKSNNEQFNHQQQNHPKTNSQTNLFVNDNFKAKNNNSSLSFQDLRSDTRTDQFLNSLQMKTTQNLLPLQQKNSLDVFGNINIDDLNNKSTAKQLFNHFGDREEPNIFNFKEDPFKDDFFNS